MSVQAGKMHGAFALGLSLRTILLVILAAAFAVRLVLVFTYEINWDEFYYLALVYDFARGELTNTLQTLHVRFFGWLALVGVNEVNQVILARFLMWVLNVATTYFIFDIARRFTSENAALLGALCYATFSLVVQHGASFRADPIAAFFLMAALWLIMCKKHYAIAGLCAGLAGMITIKTAFYAPAIGAALCLAVLHAQDKRRAVRGGLVFAAIAGASFAALYFWHRTGITATPGEGSGALLAHSYSKTISSAGLFPRWGVFWRAAITNMVFWAAFGFGVYALLRKCLRGDWKLRTESLLLLGLAAPLASFLIYRNAFPYYYAFILPPAAVLCALGFDKFTARKPDGALHPLILISVIVIAATLSANTLKALGKGLSDQRRVLAAVHNMFPESVPYIDRCSMVSAFSKQGFFMSSWGMETYYAGGVPVMRDILLSSEPKFLLGNIEALDIARIADGKHGPRYYGLMGEDVEILKQNFIPHWGPIYVAGKQFEFLEDEASKDFNVIISGIYTFESEGAFLLNGEKINPGDKRFLNRGTHTLSPIGAENRATLRWGNDLYKPSEPPPVGPVFKGF